MGEVVTTDEFAEWFAMLDDDQLKAVDHIVGLLELKGLALGHPYSSALKGTHFPFRELRSQRYSTALRIVYAYDPHRDAVLIIGGDKAGNSRFYEEITPKAEKIWKQYLKERGEEEAREKSQVRKSSGTAQSKGRKPRGH
jgi:hypothetical protein